MLNYQPNYQNIDLCVKTPETVIEKASDFSKHLQEVCWKQPNLIYCYGEELPNNLRDDYRFYGNPTISVLTASGTVNENNNVRLRSAY